MTLQVPTLNSLRLWSGLILLAFAATHLLNLAIALISVEAMHSVQVTRTEITRSMPGRVILGSAALVHIAIGLASLRPGPALLRTPWKILQHLSGLGIAILMIPHLVGMNLPEIGLGRDVTYAYAALQLWPGDAIGKALLMVLTWMHGCLGLWYWARSKGLGQRAAPWLAALSATVPTLAYAGYAVMGQAYGEASATMAAGLPVPAHKAEALAHVQSWASPETLSWIKGIKTDTKTIVRWGVGGSLVASALWVFWRHWRGSPLRVTDESGRSLRARSGQTLLEVSQANGAAHASACGGKGRCSTCRVRVLSGARNLSHPTQAETRLLGANTTDIRLACQARVLGPVEVLRIIPPRTRDPVRLVAPDPYRWGREEVLTVMFADLRGFTQFSSGKPAFDVVYTLGRFMRDSSDVIEAHGGYVDKFMGDGIMALFGPAQDPAVGAQSALRAAAGMQDRLQALNRDLAALIQTPFQLGFGLHSGPVVLGRVGGDDQRRAHGALTAIGDTVNTASRIEAQCKPMGMTLVMSQATRDLAGLMQRPDLDQTICLRGRSEDTRLLGFATVPHLDGVEKPRQHRMGSSIRMIGRRATAQ